MGLEAEDSINNCDSPPTKLSLSHTTQPCNHYVRAKRLEGGIKACLQYQVVPFSILSCFHRREHEPPRH